MKICIDISQIVYSGGVSEYTKKLIEHILKIDKKNHYTLLAYSLRQKNVFSQFSEMLSGYSYKNFCVAHYPLPISVVEPLVNKWRILKLENLVGKIDVYHASDWIQFPTKAKIVTTIHDLAPIIYPQYHDKKIIKVHRRRLELARKYADRIITVSENTKKDYLKYYDYPIDKIKVIYEAPVITPDILRHLPRGSRVCHHRGVMPKKTYVLTVSSLNPRKNIKKLIQAFTLFSKNHPQYELVVVGNFGWGERFENQKNIRFISGANLEHLARYYQNADLFVYPSLYEGFGLPVLEAMSFGVPVVTSNISSLAEIAGNAAILIDPLKESIIAQGMGKALRESKRLTKSGNEWVKRFSWGKCATETLDIYTSLLPKS